MESFFIYLGKSSLLITVFYSSYYLFLSRETFFTHNRVFLLFGVLTSFVLPLFFITKTVFIEPIAYEFITTSTESTIVIIENQPLHWWFIVGVGYFIGTIILFIQFSIQLLSLQRILRTNDRTKLNGLIMVETTNSTSPFSFFSYIVYNPNMYSANDLKTVIAHEKIHVYEKHSLDLLLMHLLCIVQWFNPFAWFYKKAASQNLEYIADHSVATKLENKKNYQYLLLDQSLVTSEKLTIINPFFNSLIKKRIIMLNQKRSKRVNTLKIGLVFPFLALFLFLINTETVAQTRHQEKTPVITEMKIEVVIDKNTTDDIFASHSKFIKEKDGIILSFSKIKRNTKGEITRVKSTFESPQGKRGVYNIKSTEPIQPFNFYYELDFNNKIKTIGYDNIKELNNTHTEMGHSANVKDVEGDDSDKTLEQFQKAFQQKVKNESITEISTTVTIDNITESDESGTKVVWSKSSLSNPTIYLDGIEKGPDFDINSIKNIGSFRALSNELALKKYGQTSENGIIEITTLPIKHEQNDWQVEESNAVEITNTNSYLNLEEFLTEELTAPLILVDGKNMGKNYKNIKIKYSQLERICTSTPNEFTSEKYGIVGKDGVIDIKTKSQD